MRNYAEKSFREQLTIFKVACRIYKKEKSGIARLEKKYPDLKHKQFDEQFFSIGLDDSLGKGDLELYQYLKENVNFVEEMFHKIEGECGADAKLLLWQLFVEAQTQEAVALSYGLTRRQVQYSMNKWMHRVLDGDRDDI